MDHKLRHLTPISARVEVAIFRGYAKRNVTARLAPKLTIHKPPKVSRLTA